jgi:glycosyltransferase involved in cell wall biosynthesis
MSSKKKILVFVDWYLPGYKAGGQIRSVAAMAGHLREEYDFYIVTGDRDLHADAPYVGVQLDSWIKLKDGSHVYYISKEKRTKQHLKKIIFEAQADILYLNSMFSYFYTFLPLTIRKKFLPGRKVILAPRGMLGKGALKIKALKKKSYLLTTKMMGLYRGITFHASSTSEEKEIQQQFGKRAKVHVAIDLVEPRQLTNVERIKNTGNIKMFFLSRISPKKNLLGTLKLLSTLPAGNSIEFDIYGPIEEEIYWKECNTVIQTMPSHVKVNYKGILENSAVIDIMSRYHLSILLTFNENYGHSIVESMAAGCPVLISDQTIWKNLKEKNAGWDIALSKENEIRNAINDACNWSQEEFNVYSQGALTFAQQIFDDKEGVEQNKKLFA